MPDLKLIQVIAFLMAACLGIFSQVASADDASIAQKLANPVASLISVPISTALVKRALFGKPMSSQSFRSHSMTTGT